MRLKKTQKNILVSILNMHLKFEDRIKLPKGATPLKKIDYSFTIDLLSFLKGKPEQLRDFSLKRWIDQDKIEYKIKGEIKEKTIFILKSDRESYEELFHLCKENGCSLEFSFSNYGKTSFKLMPNSQQRTLSLVMGKVLSKIPNSNFMKQVIDMDKDALKVLHNSIGHIINVDESDEKVSLPNPDVDSKKIESWFPELQNELIDSLVHPPNQLEHYFRNPEQYEKDCKKHSERDSFEEWCISYWSELEKNVPPDRLVYGISIKEHCDKQIRDFRESINLRTSFIKNSYFCKYINHNGGIENLK